MRSISALPLLVLLPLAACQGNSEHHDAESSRGSGRTGQMQSSVELATASAQLASWSDIPVPRGFENVAAGEDEEVSLHIGDYRSGLFVLEGRGRVEEIEAYYADRLPLHGWSWDSELGLWSKPPTTLEVSITPVEQSAYGSSGRWSRAQLRVRSRRSNSLKR